MKLNQSPSGISKLFTVLFFVFTLLAASISAQTKIPLRRTISPQQPAWFIHIDTWNFADPQKIIALVPKDIRPFVVINISLSINHDEATGRFKIAEYGYEVAKSWIRACAENQMWVMVQPSSGGYSQFSDFDLSVYEEFFREYPNFLGFNYCEQFWGFDSSTDPLSAKWTDRINHFADLLKVCNKYGGYLDVSWCGNQWSPPINPIAMLKRNPTFAAACRDYTENFILCEKYTQQAFQSDMESICLGAYLSGYSGNYGIRYDDTGWTDPSGVNSNFTMATALAPHLEHAMLTGQTVIDGPELIWTQCFKETSATTTADGLTRRNWQTFSQFDNVNIDLFRKILDGTVRIPTRQEVIDRTKVVTINDVNSNDINVTYSSPQTLFEGLYRMDGDGNYEYNKTFFKKTGRYPTIPTVFQLDDAEAQSFQLQINRSAYSNRWPTITSKVNELNQLFPEEYKGDLYAGRHENGWITYNPYKTGQSASSCIPFKYNTCDSVRLGYSQYSAGILKEYSDKITLYLNNYDNVIYTGLKNDTIKIYGSANEPTYSSTDRGKTQSSVVTKSWVDGIFTLIVQHNGPLDITINCSGAATGRLTAYTPAAVVTPQKPAPYLGPRQYETECADYKSVSSYVTNGYSGGIRNYTGQGYVIFGTNGNATIRDSVSVIKNGSYNLQFKYLSPSGNINHIDLYVNGIKVATPVFSKTSATGWAIHTQKVILNEGSNSIMLKAKSTGTYTGVFDNLVVSQDNADRIYDFTADVATTTENSPAAQFVAVKSGSAGVVSYTDGNNLTSNCIKTYSAGTLNGTGVADLELFPTNSSDYYVVWKEYTGTTEAKKGVLLRGSSVTGTCSYADGLMQGYLFTSKNNSDGTVTLETYKAATSGLISKTTFTSSFQINQNKPCWYRATAKGENLTFECSNDSLNWVGGTTTAFTDNTYTIGSTQLVWGFDTNNFSWVMDNIQCNTPFLSVSKLNIKDFGYLYSSGPGKTDSVLVAATSITDNILVSLTGNFEISLDKNAGFSSTLVIYQNHGNVDQTKIYVRAKPDLAVGTYAGSITISSNGMTDQEIALTAEVLPLPFASLYDFSNDVVTRSGQTPPALFTTIAKGNSATAGVVSYTDSKSITSNVLKPYSCGSRNSTGVINLNLFSKKASDYSVTWKQCVTSGNDYKNGVLLRGDTANVGTATIGYEAGLMQGYLFIVNTLGAGGTEFRIYKSTSSVSLNRVNTGVVSTLTPANTQPIWYRASANGTTTVTLKLEYSTDSITWNAGTTYTDTTIPFSKGATQFVWGLGISNVNFYIDNITFYGIEYSEPTSIEEIEQSDDNAIIVSTEYYTLMGQRVYNKYNNLKGIFIVRQVLSNGKIKTKKVFLQ